MFGKKAQPKAEHPMRETWDQMKQRAAEQGLLHNDGTFAFPPSGFGSAVWPVYGEESSGGQSNRALVALMKSMEEQIENRERVPRSNPDIISEVWK